MSVLRPRVRCLSKFGGWLALPAGLFVFAHCSVYDSSVLQEGSGATNGGASAGGGTAGASVAAGGKSVVSGGSGGSSAGTESALGGVDSGGAGEGMAGAGPSCSDGELNGNEVEIDCGGSCVAACPEKLCSELVAGPTLETVLASAALVGWYRFHEGQGLGVDSSGTANDAFAVEGVTQASDPERGCVAVFKGAGSLVLPAVTTTDMTLALWLQTDVAGLGQPDKNWFEGSSLLNAEQAGVVNDFGLTQLGDQIAFGVGNPDFTLRGGPGISDGVWHQVVATRDDASGEMVLYVDAVEQARGTGPVGVRDAASTLGVGWNHLVARLADIRIYDTVLTDNQVASLYTGE